MKQNAIKYVIIKIQSVSSEKVILAGSGQLPIFEMH